MRKLVTIAISAAWLSSASPLLAVSLGEQFGNGAAHVGLHGGTLGAGVNAGYDFSNDLAIRGLVNYFNLDFDGEKAGNEYDGELDLRSLGLLVDWHPFWGAFRMSGGAFLNNNRLSASTEGMALNIGNHEYPADLSFRMEFEKAAPYLGIGWTSGRGGGGLSFTADIGALFRSTPRVSASGRIRDCGFTVSREGDADVDCSQVPGILEASLERDMERDLELEHDALQDDLDKLKIYPVISLGLSYRF